MMVHHFANLCINTLHEHIIFCMTSDVIIGSPGKQHSITSNELRDKVDVRKLEIVRNTKCTSSTILAY